MTATIRYTVQGSSQVHTWGTYETTNAETVKAEAQRLADAFPQVRGVWVEGPAEFLTANLKEVSARQEAEAEWLQAREWGEER